MKLLHSLLSHPLTRGLSVDDPATTHLRRDIIRGKPFLRALYTEWYRLLLQALPKKPQGSPAPEVLELGSGAGFLKELFPSLITSDLFPVPGISHVVDACHLPFPDQSLDAIVMTNVFHHIPDVRAFFRESARCLRPGGKILMIEPWRTRWSDWVYSRLHLEPFDPAAPWEFPRTGPLSGANGALPWIVFVRDLARFEEENPRLKIRQIRSFMPVSYLLSGGVSMRSLAPGFLYRPVRFLESFASPSWANSAMFAFIEVELLPLS